MRESVKCDLCGYIETKKNAFPSEGYIKWYCWLCTHRMAFTVGKKDVNSLK